MPAQPAPKKSKSVKKRIRQTKKRTLRNRSVRSLLKSLTKRVESDVVQKKTEEAQVSLTMAITAIDKAKNKGIIHRNTASRKVSRLTKLVNSLTRPEAT